MTKASKQEDHSFVMVVGDKKLVCTPAFRDEYSTGYFETGNVECTNDDSWEDVVYLSLKRGEEESLLFLRPDEAISISWLLSGVLNVGMHAAYMETHINEKTPQQQGNTPDQAWKNRVSD